MTVFNMLGQAVDGSRRENLASGLYWYSDPTEADHNCGSLRPGFMVLNGTVINVCNGTTTTAHLPDIYLTDDKWKPFIQYGLVGAIGILAFALVKRYAL